MGSFLVTIEHLQSRGGRERKGREVGGSDKLMIKWGKESNEGTRIWGQCQMSLEQQS